MHNFKTNLSYLYPKYDGTVSCPRISLQWPNKIALEDIFVVVTKYNSLCLVKHHGGLNKTIAVTKHPVKGIGRIVFRAFLSSFYYSCVLFKIFIYYI